jgi:hypothetical protein
VRAKLGVALADMVAIDGDGLGWTVYESVVLGEENVDDCKRESKAGGKPDYISGKKPARAGSATNEKCCHKTASGS